MRLPAAAQNDPTELLEVFSSRGKGLGEARSRAAMHRQGIWHQAFHCWIVRGTGANLEVVLQRRALAKDTFPGCWDAAAAGHWRLGERPEEAAREVAEELGLAAPFAQLRWIGRERIARVHPNGMLDREHHQVYLLAWPAPLTTYRPNPAEVADLAAVPARALVALAAGRIDAVPASEAVTVEADGTPRPSSAVVRRSELVPYSAARLRRLVRAAAA